MDSWIAQQSLKKSEDWLAQQVAPTNSFDADAWLAKQRTKKTVGDFLRGHAASDSMPTMDDTEESSETPWVPASSWEAEDLERSLLADIEEALGGDHRRAVEARIKVIEKDIQYVFQVLPKNEYEKLGHSAVRYLLHRFFVEQHGWFIDGLFSEGDARNMSSPSHALQNRVPMFVEGLFEKRLGGRGFGTHELAVMVAVVEDSVHREAQEQLLLTYKALSIPRSTNLSHELTELVVEAYMSGFVMNTNMSEISEERLRYQRRTMRHYYPTWLRARKFFFDIREKHTAGKDTVNFALVSGIIREIVDTFGKFHGRQCQGLKDSLKGLEKKGSSGCVQLPDFYEKGLKADTNWLLVETPEYLRQVGVLDDSNPQNPRLLTANYINSPTNCLQPSGYYLVCCHNECDDILGQLERQLAKPSASPDEILEALGRGSFSIPWIRGQQIPEAISFRLAEVAEYNGGDVPLHGRLFAQWLHHVFPRECPYPHLSGTRSLQYIRDFEDETGRSAQMSHEEMASIVQNASKKVAPERNETMQRLNANFGSGAPWQDEEELFVGFQHSIPHHDPANDPHVWNLMGCVALLGAVCAFVVTLMRTFKSVARLTKLGVKTKTLYV
jgi:hypothetical protein